MKKLNKYLMLFVAAFALVGCVDDVTETPSMEAQTGDEVQFGLTLPSSRLVYDQENPVKENGKITAFPLYWTNKDKVFIFSSDCLDGRRGAEYEVGVDNDNAQNYATSLTKTGAFGVQWGEDETATFYSLFPSGQYGLSDGNSLVKDIWVNYKQNILVNGSVIKSDMEDCLLYARTENVAKGTTVNLNYEPITTTFMVKLQVDGASQDSFTITSIDIIAPEGTNIAGKFDINVNNGSFADWAGEDQSNIVNANIKSATTGGFHTIAPGEAVEFPMFLAPVPNLNTAGWKIQVQTQMHGTFTKTLSAQDITPGQVHMISLPKLSVDKQITEEEWDVSTWMKNIPGNVYLSEISIPGSWNSLNQDSQGDTEGYTTISTQYKKGVRAFHLDTRWKRTGSSNNYKYELGIAIGGSGNTTNGDNKYMTDGATFEDALTEIIGNISDDEYMVVVCTFAQNSAQYNGATGWVNAISEICDKYNTSIYDAKKLTQNTVVGDVRGKVIVIVNMEGAFTEVPSDTQCLFINYPMTMTRNLFPSTLSDVLKGPIYKGVSKSTSFAESGVTMYRSHSQICFGEESYSYSRPSDSARDNVDGRGFMPTNGERKTVANNILNWSKSNYNKEGEYLHNNWIYLGLGGYYFTRWVLYITSGFDNDENSYDDVASYYNTWINGKVTEMGTTPSGQTAIIPYYPVGIVLMNYVNNYSSTLKNILLLNNKYQLRYDSTKPDNYKATVETEDDTEDDEEEGA